MRGVSDRNLLDAFCEEFCAIVEKHCPYILVSGYVAISSGRVRATEDVDMITSKLSFEQFVGLHQDLCKEFVCVQSEDPATIYEYLTSNTSVRYTFKNKPLPEMELKFAKDALDEFQISTRTKLPLTGLGLWFSSIPVNIAFKEELLKSDKDLKDAEHLRKVYPELADERQIQEVKKMIRRYRL